MSTTNFILLLAAGLIIGHYSGMAIIAGIEMYNDFMINSSSTPSALGISTAPIYRELTQGDRFELVVSHFDSLTNQTLYEQKNATTTLLTRTPEGQFREQPDIRDTKTGQYLVGRIGYYDPNIIFAKIEPIGDLVLDTEKLKAVNHNLAYLLYEDINNDMQKEWLIGLSTQGLSYQRSEAQLFVPWLQEIVVKQKPGDAVIIQEVDDRFKFNATND